jgi:hypothetical protein
VNRKGKNIKPQSKIYWTGVPKSFAIIYPLIVAFNSSFIEIWNLETLEIEQILHANGLKCLTDNTQSLHFVDFDDTGRQKLRLLVSTNLGDFKAVSNAS